jgi:hypothetical protein
VSAKTSPPTEGPPLNDPDRLELAQTMLRETREEISRADAKAATLLAGTGIAVGALLAGLIAGDWVPADLGNSVEWLWWVGVVAAGYGIWRLTGCILPVVVNDEQSDLIDFFGDIARFSSADELAIALAAGPTDLYGRIVRQLHVNARIVTNKYRQLKFALASLGVGAAGTATAVLLDLVA